MDNLSLQRELFKKYALNYDKDNPDSKANDVYVHRHYTIITRQGIQKIERATGIKCELEYIPTPEPRYVVIKGTGRAQDGTTYTTFASASPETSKNPYYVEMAEKRCRSRLILTLAGLYELGAFGEDEADSFSDVVAGKGNNLPKSVAYKGQ